MKFKYPTIIFLLFSALTAILKCQASENENAVAKPTSKYYVELAKIHQKHGFYNDAIECYKKAIVLESGEEERQKLGIGLGGLYLLSGDLEKAESIVLKVIESEKNPEKCAEYYLLLATICEKTGKHDKAIGWYQFVLNYSNDYLFINTAKQKMINLLKEAGKFEEYVASLEKKVAENPEDIRALECLAFAYSTDDIYSEKAQPVYEKLFSLKPDNRAIANRLIEMYKHSKEHEKAAAVYIKLMEASPKIMNRFYNERIAETYSESGNYKEALKWGKKALDEDKDNPYSYLKVAEACQALEEYNEAEKMYHVALKKLGREDDKESVSLKLIDLYILMGKQDEARKLSFEIFNSTKDDKMKKEIETRITKISEHLHPEDN